MSAPENPKIAAVEAEAEQVKGMVSEALSKLHSAVDSVITLAEPAGICPYTEHKCPLWDELSRLRADQSAGH